MGIGVYKSSEQEQTLSGKSTPLCKFLHKLKAHSLPHHCHDFTSRERIQKQQSEDEDDLTELLKHKPSCNITSKAAGIFI